MSGPFSILFVLAIVLGVGTWARVAARRREAELAATARALGLRYEPSAWWSSGGKLSGALDGVQVRREPHVVSSGKNRKVYTRFLAYGAPPDVVVKREGLGQRLVKALGGEDQLVGDPAFDGRFVVKGDPVAVSAALGAEARVALEVAGQGAVAQWVERGVVGVQVSGELVSLSTVHARLEAVARVVRGMRVEANGMPDRLASIARDDPAPGARARAMVLLAGVDAAAAAPVLRDALADTEVAMRVHAALLLRDPAATRALLREAGLPTLSRVDLLGSLRDAGSVRELVELLDHEDSDVRSRAVDALGQVGGREEVAPLVALREREGWGELGRRAGSAIAAIQGRLGPVDAGRLALADGGSPLEGALSESGPEGAVSVVAAARIGERDGG